MFAATDRTTRFLLISAFAAAAALYALQVFTPLRLTSDGITYLSLADSATRNGVWTEFSQPGFPFPKGYPLFIFFFMKAGLFSSATLVISNVVLFALGLFFSFRTLLALKFDRTDAQVACLLSALCFASVKHITQGMSDFLFFALASCACWLLTSNHRYRWLGIGLCTAAAIEVRFIGLALIAPILTCAWPFLRKRLLAVAITSGLGVAMLIAGLLAGHHYLGSNALMLRNNGLWRFAGRTFIAHVQDFGEIIANVPLSKIPAELRVPVLFAGVAAMLIFFTGAVALRRRSIWLCSYLVAYSLLVLPWPYTDPRFWVPVMPFVLLSFHEGLTRLFREIPKGFVVAYTVLFCLCGFTALAYSSKLTFAGQQFAKQYGDGRLTNAYLDGCKASTNAIENPGEQEARVLLQRYEWHCRDTELLRNPSHSTERSALTF